MIIVECVFPPELDDKKLWEYIDGEADQETTHHLEGCAYCRKRAVDLIQLRDRVGSRLYRMHCPSSLRLGEYHLRLLPKADELVVAQHVRECSHCQLELAELEEFLVEPDVQSDLFMAARVLIARLLDSGATPAFGALRGESKGPLTFEADGVVITLDVQPGSNSHLSILGQLAADDQDEWTGAKVELQQADISPLTTSLDDLGAFRFEAVRPGATKFIITSTASFVIETPEIDLTT